MELYSARRPGRPVTAVNRLIYEPLFWSGCSVTNITKQKTEKCGGRTGEEALLTTCLEHNQNQIKP